MLAAPAFGEYERMAIVTDATWVRRTVKAMGWLIPGDVRVYPYRALDEARTRVVG